MAPSKALRKAYTDQTQRCVFAISQTSKTRPIFQRILPSRAPVSHRAFGTTISIQAVDLAPRKTTDTKDQTRPQSSFGISQPRQSRSIDLSSIMSNPGYRRPAQKAPMSKTPISSPGETNIELDKFLQSSRARSPPTESDSRSTTSFNPQTQRAPTSFNADVYATGRTVKPRTPGSPGFTNSIDLMHKMIGGKAESAKKSSVFELTSDFSRETRVVLRLKPSLGRQVFVRNDLTKAFQTLEYKINGRGNAVRREEREQKFHVRKGQQKKITKRARWRALFKQGYIAELTRVRKMIKQGW